MSDGSWRGSFFRIVERAIDYVADLPIFITTA